MSATNQPNRTSRKDIAVMGRVIEELFRAASASTESDDARVIARRRLYLATAKRLHERCESLEQQPRVAQRPLVDPRRPRPAASPRGSHPTPRLPVVVEDDATPIMGHATLT
jgi:hypothetical protein